MAEMNQAVATMPPASYNNEAKATETVPDLQKGELAFLQGDYATAKQELTPLAHAGNPVAQTNLGLMLLNGDGGKRDRASALKWFTLAAEQGYAEAQYNLGLIYGKGIGVAKDYDYAYKQFTRAATQNYPHAQYSLGVLCFRGKGNGGTKDFVQAYKWFSIAATAEVKHAAFVRDEIAKRLTADQINEAEKIAQEQIQAFK